MKKQVVVLITILASICLLGLTWSIIKNNIVGQAEKIVVSNLDLSNLEAGIYTGECSLSPVKVVVEVYVKDKTIKDIEILEHQNGLGKKAETVIEQVIKEQKLDVDLVAGATVSSKVILKAVENALSVQ
ncbi:MAG TPA: FMN-binding protein [Firmicutes bacterium]|nr:FMN-binding protein [Bacillota bacterium]